MDRSVTSYATIAAALLVVLPLLARIGWFGVLTGLVIGFALNVLPYSRHIIDGFTGESVSGKNRLNLSELPTSTSLPNNYAQSIPESQLQLEEPLYTPVNDFISLIHRDFISFWYSNSIALSAETPFPKHTRALLNSTLVNIITKVKQQDAKQVSIYLFHSASNVVINQLQAVNTAPPPPSVRAADKEELLAKIRKTAHELILTFSPHTYINNPIVLSLLVEVMSLQIWSSINTIGDPDFLNRNIVDHLGSAVKVVKDIKRQTANAPVSDDLLQDRNSSVVDTAEAIIHENIEDSSNVASEVTQADADSMQAGPPPLAPRNAQQTTFAASFLPGIIQQPVFMPSKQETVSRSPNAAIAKQAVGASNQAAGSASTSTSPMSSTSALPSTSGSSGQKSVQAPAMRASPSASSRDRQNSNRTTPAPSNYDKTIDEAFDIGVAKLSSFKSKFMNNATKFLDSIGVEDADTVQQRQQQQQQGQQHRKAASIASTGSSYKGKERERDPPLEESNSSPYSSPRDSMDYNTRSSSPRPDSVRSKMSIQQQPITSPAVAGGSISSRRSSVILNTLSDFINPAPSPQKAPTYINPLVRVSKILDSNATASPEQQSKDITSLEQSLSGKDLKYLFPEFSLHPAIKSIMSASHSNEYRSYTSPDIERFSENFHDFLDAKDDNDLGQGLMRLYTQIYHFEYMLDTTLNAAGSSSAVSAGTEAAREKQLQSDLVNFLLRIIKQSIEILGIELEKHDYSEQEKYLITFTELTALKILQNPLINSDAKELWTNLKEYYLEQIHQSYWEEFLVISCSREDRQMIQELSAPAKGASQVGSEPVPEASTSRAPAINATRVANQPVERPITPAVQPQVAIESSESRNIESTPMAASSTLLRRSSSRYKPSTVVDTAGDDTGDVGASALYNEDDSVPSPRIPSPTIATGPHAVTSLASQTEDHQDPVDLLPPVGDDAAEAVPDSSQNTEVTTEDSQPSESRSVSMEPVSFSVTLTDLSPPSAYVNNHVKQRKELEFLIAVEAEGSPGYILARKYTEFEKMDTGIKKALPQSGTKAFPRAPLPSTNFQTSENLCRSLESYLEALLKDHRYASSLPVATFFAKERTDSGQGQIQPLAFLNRGVENIGKGVTGVTRGIGKSGEMAIGNITNGLNQFGKAVVTLPKMKRKQSEKDTTSELAGSLKSSDSTSTIDQLAPAIDPSTEVQLGDTNPQAETEDHVVEVQAISSPSPVPAIARPPSPQGYEVSSPSPTIASPSNKPQSAGDAIPLNGLKYTPRKRNATQQQSVASSPALGETTNREASSDSKVPETPTQSQKSPVLRGRMSFDELLKQDEKLLQRVAFEKEEEADHLSPATAAISTSAGMRRSSSEPERGANSTPAAKQRASSELALSTSEFNNILSFAMAILEEAYNLADTRTWNFKRGILRVLETMLRTSYANVIKAGVLEFVAVMSKEDFYANNINKLKESFWPPPNNIWWSSVEGSAIPERTAEEKEATRIEARRLILLQAPEGLKVSLGPTATAEAFGRLHDSLQGPGSEKLVAALVLDYLRLLLL